MATKGELAELQSELAELNSKVNSLRADGASDMVLMEARLTAEDKKTRDQIVGLRRAVLEYHSSVVGHGMLISELEARVRRVEQHLDLPPMEAH